MKLHRLLEDFIGACCDWKFSVRRRSMGKKKLAKKVSELFKAIYF